MGQAGRAMSYDRASNVRNAVPALEFIGTTTTSLKWHRLDDGVMGGRSQTVHTAVDGSDHLHFKGTINTDGGGFASVRAPIPDGLPENAIAVRIKYRGDGRTYKVLLSDGGGGGPLSRSPSWQIDVPTDRDDDDGASWQETTLPLEQFSPSFGGAARSRTLSGDERLVPSEMRELGFMLSLKLSNGEPNPPETFGDGVFDFSLFVASVSPVLSTTEK